MLRTLMLASCCLSLIGCAGTRFEWAQAKAVRVGMTTEEVENLLGKPHTVHSRADGSQTWIWSGANGLLGSVQAVSFPVKDGRVTSVPVIPFD